MVKNKQLERDLVEKPCLKIVCPKYKEDGVILQYRKLDAQDKDHQDGSPDIEIFMEKDGYLFVLMVECKKPDGGKQRKTQVEYQNRYSHLKNVVYVIVRSKEELAKEIDKINPYYYNQIQGLNL